MRAALILLALSGCGFVSKSEYQKRVGGGPQTDPVITTSTWPRTPGPAVDGQHADLAVDDQGRHHVVYRDMTDRQIVYAVGDGLGGWTTQWTYPTPDDTFLPTAIAVGTDGTVHIAFAHHENAGDATGVDIDEVRYARLGGGEPLIITVDDTQKTTSLDIVVENDVARIAYQPFNANNGGIKFATINGEPPYNAALMANEAGDHLRVVADGDGWAASHNSAYGEQVFLSRGIGDDYAPQLICSGCNAAGTAVAIDGDIAHVAWYESDVYEEGGTLMYASDANDWQAVPIDRSATWAEGLWMGVDGDGTPWICYGHDEGWGSGDLRLAHLEGDEWKLQQVGNSGDTWLWCQGNTAPDGSLHMLYRKGGNFFDAVSGFEISSSP